MKRSLVIRTSILAVATAPAAFSQGTLLIGPSIRNGSFEDGVLAPWTDDFRSASVALGLNFASEGVWYAVVSQTASGSIVRAGTGHWLRADRSDGLTFSLTFDARNGTAAFDEILVALGALNSDGSNVPTMTKSFNPPSPEWQNLQARFQLSDSWDGGGNIFLGFQFGKGNAVPGTTYNGYLDNVILQQVPEPSTWALAGLGLVGLGLWRRKARNGNRFS